YQLYLIGTYSKRTCAGAAKGVFDNSGNIGIGLSRCGQYRLTYNRSRKLVKFTLRALGSSRTVRSEEHTSELQSRENLVCRLLHDLAPDTISTLSLHDALPILPALSHRYL